MMYIKVLFPLIGFITGWIVGFLIQSSYQKRQSDFWVLPLYVSLSFALIGYILAMS